MKKNNHPSQNPPVETAQGNIPAILDRTSAFPPVDGQRLLTEGDPNSIRNNSLRSGVRAAVHNGSFPVRNGTGADIAFTLIQKVEWFLEYGMMVNTGNIIIIVKRY